MPEITSSRYMVNATWDDVPHLDEKTKRELLAATPPHLREARVKGIPSMGAGAIYPIAWEDVIVDPFRIPDHWKRSYALDVGWKTTAAVWGAIDPATNVNYIYGEYARGQVEPHIHAAAIKARGDWMKGVIDPASAGSSQKDGSRLILSYSDLGLKLRKANNEVEAGLFDVYTALVEGTLKFFSNLKALEKEYRLYRRDEKGKVVKEFDHLLDCVRYWYRSGRAVASVKLPERRRMTGGSVRYDH